LNWNMSRLSSIDQELLACRYTPFSIESISSSTAAVVVESVADRERSGRN
jgi:hypothetical protein